MELGSVVFWPAAGAQIGLGHFFRCLALAQEVRGAALCSFFLDMPDPRMQQVLDSHDVPYCFRETDDFTKMLRNAQPHMLVIDSPFLPPETVAVARKAASGLKIVILSDHSPAATEADIVFEPHVVAQWRMPADVSGPEIYRGPDYWILRPAFDPQLGRMRMTGQNIMRVLIAMGGTDCSHATLPMGRMVLASLPQVRVEVVCGPLFSESKELAELSRNSNGRLAIFHAPENMPELMWSADIAVTAAGYTAYEFAALGVPMILWPVEDHQYFTARALSEKGCGIVADQYSLPHALISLAAGAQAREQMSQGGRALVDGRGRKRVARILLHALSEAISVAARCDLD